MAIRRLVSFHLSVLAFLLIEFPCTQGFASNLIVTTIGCMTDLSTEEVIMNNVVKSPEDSDFPKMHLVVLDAGRNFHESPYHYPPDDTEVSVAFVNPYSEDEFSEDLQFVMEVEGPASFVAGGTIGCDGDIRVAGRLADKIGRVVLKINDPTAKLRIWGGWATGQNSVRLTPDLILEPAPPGSLQRQKVEKVPEREEMHDLQQLVDEHGEVAADVKEGLETPETASAQPKRNLLQSNIIPKEIEELAKVAGHMKQKISRNRNSNNEEDPDSDVTRQRGAADFRKVARSHQLNLAEHARQGVEQTQNRYKDLAQRIRDVKKAKQGTKRQQRGDEDEEEQLDPQDMEEEIKRAKYLEMKRKISDQRSAKHRKHLEVQMREKYDKADNISDLNLVSFGIGCGFFILSVGAILIVYGKKRDKGRRDL